MALFRYAYFQYVKCKVFVEEVGSECGEFPKKRIDAFVLRALSAFLAACIAVYGFYVFCDDKRVYHGDFSLFFQKRANFGCEVGEACRLYFDDVSLRRQNVGNIAAYGTFDAAALIFLGVENLQCFVQFAFIERIYH